MYGYKSIKAKKNNIIYYLAYSIALVTSIRDYLITYIIFTFFRI